jgi:hypothetical protein
MTLKLFHARDFDSGFRNILRIEASKNRWNDKAVSAIMEVRAYNYSIPIADKKGFSDIVNEHRGYSNDYKVYLPSGWEKFMH